RSLAVIVVGSRNRNSIDLLADLIEEFSVVLKLPGLRELLALLIERCLVNIAQRNDVGTASRCIRTVAIALTTGADTGQVDLVISAQNPSHEGKTQCSRAAGDRSALDEIASG